MSCYRFDLHRKYVHYLHGVLSPIEQNRMETHLSKCRHCTEKIAKLRAMETLLTDLPAQEAGETLWPKVQSRLESFFPRPAVPLWKRAAAIAAFGLISGLIGAAAYGKLSNRESLSGFNPSEFKSVPITRMANTTEPHVVTEGYVIEAKVEEDDGDRVFKLVEQLGSSGPFVICEVIEPLEVPIPPVGSRVRVYGVSRFDGQSDHNWHELHPVLNIEVLNPSKGN